jgi:hypothetical protein
MAFSIPAGTEAELAAEFRKRALQITAHAATHDDATLRSCYLDIASSYQRMAEHVEKKLGSVARALQMPTQVEAAAEIAAAAPPPSDPADDGT